jgi:hypothetical protein
MYKYNNSNLMIITLKTSNLNMLTHQQKNINKCCVWIVKKYNYFNLTDKNKKIVDKIKEFAKNGDIITGTDIIHDSISAFYIKENKLQIDQHCLEIVNIRFGLPKEYFAIPENISSLITNPIEFFSNVMCKSKFSFKIDEIVLNNIKHQNILSKYIDDINENFKYVYGDEYEKTIYILNKSDGQYISSIKI